MVTNFGNRNFMQPMRGLIMHSKCLDSFFILSFGLGRVGGDSFFLFPFVPNGFSIFSLGLQCVP